MDIPFYPVPRQDIIDRLAVICGSEGVNITMSQLGLIADAHPGDLRNCINALQAFASFEKDADAVSFLHSLNETGFNTTLFLKLCFKEKDFDAANGMLEGQKPREVVRQIFRFAINGDAAVKSKMRVIDAAVTAERDIIDGVDPDIALSNFVLILIEG